jgi:hypothetical protein
MGDLSTGKKKYKFDQKSQEKRTVDLLRRKYTTRQIMELMELRRRQQGLIAEETATVEPNHNPSREEKAAPAALVPDSPVVAPEVLEPSWDETPVRPELQSSPRVISDFSDAPGDALKDNPSFKTDLSVVGNQVQTIEPVQTSLESFTASPVVTIEASTRRWYEKPLRHVTSFLDYLGKAVIDGILTAGAFIVFFVMLAQVLQAGTSQEYPQGPFIFLTVLLGVWSTRGRLHKGKKAFWRGVFAFAIGLAIFSYGVYSQMLYAQVGGFVVACLGLFRARYTKEAAERLVLPLSCLFFVVAPPSWLAQTISPLLNTWIAQGSEFLLRALHIPTAWSGYVLNMSGYEFFTNSDQAAFRSLMSAWPLALLYAHIYAKRGARTWLVMLAVTPLVLIAGMLHGTLTGWVSYTYGSPYSGQVYEWAGIILFSVLWIFLITDSLASEEEQF